MRFRTLSFFGTILLLPLIGLWPGDAFTAAGATAGGGHGEGSHTVSSALRVATTGLHASPHLHAGETPATGPHASLHLHAGETPATGPHASPHLHAGETAAPRPASALADEARSASHATGTIRGEVVLPARAARRVADRYPGAAGGPARAQPSVPAVAYLSETTTGGARGAGATADIALAQRDTAFVPALLVVPVGTTASFPNHDPFFHNVFSYSRPKRFDLGRYAMGESKSIEFDRPGYLKVFCEIHEWMRAGILVVENPHHALVEEDGSFTISGVPAGRHTLTVIDFDRGDQDVVVEVPAGGSVQVRVEFGR